MSSEVETLAQTKQMDSLKQVLLTAKEDTNKVKVLNNLSAKSLNIGSYDSSLIYAGDALLLAKKLVFQNGIAKAYNNTGNAYNLQGNYPEALKNYLACLKIKECILPTGQFH
jgi:tetratricopeptide (TPR) repeat protein